MPDGSSNRSRPTPARTPRWLLVLLVVALLAGAVYWLSSDRPECGQGQWLCEDAK